MEDKKEIKKKIDKSKTEKLKALKDKKVIKK